MALKAMRELNLDRASAPGLDVVGVMWRMWNLRATEADRRGAVAPSWHIRFMVQSELVCHRPGYAVLALVGVDDERGRALGETYHAN